MIWEGCLVHAQSQHIYEATTMMQNILRYLLSVNTQLRNDPFRRVIIS